MAMHRLTSLRAPRPWPLLPTVPHKAHAWHWEAPSLWVSAPGCVAPGWGKALAPQLLAQGWAHRWPINVCCLPQSPQG